jgi:putative transposase
LSGYVKLKNREKKDHLGYESNDRQEKEGTNRRNGYSHKTLKTSFGDVPIEVPRDQEASFVPKVIPKRTTNVSGIEDKVLSMYAKGMSQRDIAATIEDIYGFEYPMKQSLISPTAYWNSNRNGRPGP